MKKKLLTAALVMLPLTSVAQEVTQSPIEDERFAVAVCANIFEKEVPQVGAAQKDNVRNLMNTFVDLYESAGGNYYGEEYARAEGRAFVVMGSVRNKEYSAYKEKRVPPANEPHPNPTSP